MPHISFSELKIWAECPFKHKLMYIDKIKGFIGNEYTAFGGAIHSLCENALLGRLPEEDYEEYFQHAFRAELKKVPVSKPKLVMEMLSQANRISPEVIPAVESYFGNFEVVTVEEQLFEKIENFEDANYNFKGFIDFVAKTEDGKYHIVDWKTCSWGWDAERRTDRITTYQLTLYKKFFCQKHNIDPSMVETHFALLKRTAKKDHVEFFRVTSGPRKTNNASDLLLKALSNINRQIKFKNRLSCDRCDFRKSEHCK
tara:strand:- start:8703 stop:9470 length:768 start_codon:yes stop_codon:yes gene_type:complete